MKTVSFLRFMLLGTLAVLTPIQASAQSTTAPTITTQPTSLAVVAGASATFTVVASGSGALSYSWFKEGRLMSFGSSATLTFGPASPADAGVYRVVVMGAGGSTVSNAATLTVTSAAPPSIPPPATGTAPVITTPPASIIVTAGAKAEFTVVATGTAPLHYQWFKNNRAIEASDAATLTLAAANLEDAAVYTVRVTNSAGGVTSVPASLTVNATAGLITTAPATQTANAGVAAAFTVVATGNDLTYQWRFNGRPIPGATGATLTLANAGTTAAGNYSVTVSKATGPVAASAAALAIKTDARLVNIATRGHVGDDDEVLISGFVTRGDSEKKILLRAVGPTLGTAFGVAGALSSPTLTLYRGSTIIDSNSRWGGSADLAAAFALVGAFPLPATSADAALLKTLASGTYTAMVTAPRGAGGVALVEAYDADTGSPSAEVVNISTRALVGSEVADTLIAGFAITGTTSDTVLIRGVGPSLGTLFGMRRALGASHVAVYDSRGNQVAANTVWGRAGRGEDNDREDEDKESDIDDASDRAGAWRLPRGSTDSALLLTLAPGVYTAHVTGVKAASGIGLVEIFEVH